MKLASSSFDEIAHRYVFTVYVLAQAAITGHYTLNPMVKS